MKVIAANAGPRKDWNTATMLKSALEGAESVGARITLGARERVVQMTFAILLWLIGIVLLLREAGIA